MLSFDELYCLPWEQHLVVSCTSNNSARINICYGDCYEIMTKFNKKKKKKYEWHNENLIKKMTEIYCESEITFEGKTF